MRVGVSAQADTFLFYCPTGKAFPLGGRWRGTRRMRGKCPAAANFSLISRLRRQLPPKGEAKDAVCPLCRNVRMAARAAYMPPLQATRYFRVTAKAFPLGGRWRGTRRMRGKCPAAANFSLISRLRRQLPPKGEAKDAVCPLHCIARMTATGGIYAAPTSNPVFSRGRYVAGGVTTPRRKSLPLGGKVARNAPDEGKMSGSCPLISHLR